MIGRSDDANIRIIAPTIGREHCRLDPKGNGFTIQDLNSKNGTLLNGEKLDLAEEKVLKCRDEIAVGCVRLMFLKGEDDDGTVVDVETTT